MLRESAIIKSVSGMEIMLTGTIDSVWKVLLKRDTPSVHSDSEKLEQCDLKFQWRYCHKRETNLMRFTADVLGQP